jgi:multicomponent Na+:H+ antiporter subunit G
MSYAAAALMLIGAFFCAVAALGVLRFPDIYTRLHAASKAGPLGAGLILLSVAFASEDVNIAVRSVLGLVFLIVTAPVSGHLLARAARLAGIVPANVTSIRDPSGND